MNVGQDLILPIGGKAGSTCRWREGARLSIETRATTIGPNRMTQIASFMIARRFAPGSGARSSQASSRSSSASTGGDQVCEIKIRAAEASGDGTWSRTPPVATWYRVLPAIRSPSRNVGMPSASRRILGALAWLGCENVATVTSEVRSPGEAKTSVRGGSSSSSTSCLGQSDPGSSVQKSSQIAQ